MLTSAMAEVTKDIIYPPKEERVSDKYRNCLIISYDLEATGLCDYDAIIQIGAYVCRTTGHHLPEFFSQYILPTTVTHIHPEAVEKTGLELRDGHLYDVRTNTDLQTVTEAEALQRFLDWMILHQNMSKSAGVILISHGAIFLDIPLLIQALHRTSMVQQFFKTVKGFCDSNAIFQEDKVRRYGSLSLQHLYQTIVGQRKENHRADGDAKDLYDLLRRHFKAHSLSLSIRLLGRYTYTSRCMEKYVVWKQHMDEKMIGLRIIVTNWRNQSEKKKKIILKNLVAAGFDIQTLTDEYFRSRSSEVFRRQLRVRLKVMKENHESYLSDTAFVHKDEVVSTVMRYFEKKR